MKKLITGGLLVLVWMTLHAQTGDEVLMRIGGRDVLRSEFEYAYNKNNAQNKTLLTDFTQSFIHLKLQALEAESRGLDTLSSFREKMDELASRFGQATPASLVDVPEKAFPRTKIAHLFIYLPQNASARTIRMANDRMDSVYRVVTAGQKFEELVRRCMTARTDGMHGEVVMLCPNHTMEEVERKIRSLQTGELSRPFVSPAGVHLIQVMEREEKGGNKEVEEDSEVKPDNKQTFLLAELREHLLRDALNEHSETGNARPEQLASYFKKHKKKYAWELPHHKGCVLYCKDKSSAKEMKKRLKRVPVERWAEVVEQYNMKHPDKPVKAECGLFQIGTNAAVDKLVFKQGTFLPSADYPYVMAVGKKLRKGPDSYLDVYRQVENDYKIARQTEEVGAWLKKYKVEIKQEVLKTVNNH